jgi:hypothetical protein
MKRKSLITFPSVIIPPAIINPKFQTCAELVEASEILNEEFLLPNHHPQTPGLLGITRMSHHTALLHPGGRRDDEPCHLVAQARSYCWKSIRSSFVPRKRIGFDLISYQTPCPNHDAFNNPKLLSKVEVYKMTQKASAFQEIILKLQDFWASHGCLITQPYFTCLDDMVGKVFVPHSFLKTNRSFVSLAHGLRRPSPSQNDSMTDRIVPHLFFRKQFIGICLNASLFLQYLPIPSLKSEI